MRQGTRGFPRIRPALITLGLSAAVCGLIVLLVGLPGPCAGGGLLGPFFERHQGAADDLSFVFYAGVLVCLLSVPWLAAAATARMLRRA